MRYETVTVCHGENVGPVDWSHEYAKDKPDHWKDAEQNPEGPGSVTGMAADPVTVAASNNPMLKTLTQALSGQLNPNVNLVDTLNGGEFTVFAPTDDAFAAFAEHVRRVPEVLECHMVAGGFDYLVKVRSRDMADFRRIMAEKISGLPHVSNTSSNVAMEAVVEQNFRLG